MAEQDHRKWLVDSCSLTVACVGEGPTVALTNGQQGHNWSLAWGQVHCGAEQGPYSLCLPLSYCTQSRKVPHNTRKRQGLRKSGLL